ncbi:hypothetical protein Rsub_09381 [Raphidocelis subcapitata]|uniref:Uncharacterized protein n=1 Tax=Raphidocelis subcapitata TaxID=307507 RepID=A0A2V0PHT9_9CHLO|nr:hypothetical protein Rsub_09381 [Raphidocelis subcapitata]|eukprot:GBF96635.1 hypothetical protein Rsub_09381 [Raphidocelis subcapitata]
MAALHPWQRLQADPALLDDFAPLWRLVEAVRECRNVRAEAAAIAARAPSHADCQVIALQLMNVHQALRETIETGTRVGRESGYGSVIAGRRVSLGSDDGFTDFLSYLVSLGADACKRILSDPESAMPPRKWAHFGKGHDGGWRPRQREGFVHYALSEYCEESYPGAPRVDALWVEQWYGRPAA